MCALRLGSTLPYWRRRRRCVCICVCVCECVCVCVYVYVWEWGSDARAQRWTRYVCGGAPSAVECALCRSDAGAESLLRCDGPGCSRAVHVGCGRSGVPPGAWYCAPCRRRLPPLPPPPPRTCAPPPLPPLISASPGPPECSVCRSGVVGASPLLRCERGGCRRVTHAACDGREGAPPYAWHCAQCRQLIPQAQPWRSRGGVADPLSAMGDCEPVSVAAAGSGGDIAGAAGGCGVGGDGVGGGGSGAAGGVGVAGAAAVRTPASRSGRKRDYSRDKRRQRPSLVVLSAWSPPPVLLECSVCHSGVVGASPLLRCERGGCRRVTHAACDGREGAPPYAWHCAQCRQLIPQAQPWRTPFGSAGGSGVSAGGSGVSGGGSGGGEGDTSTAQTPASGRKRDRKSR